MTEEELKQKLQGEHVIDASLIQSMINHIGSVDSELRDGLIYGTFSTWIMEDRLTGDQLAELLDISLELLFKGIGESGTDTVFTRSFASLWIAAILYSDNQHDFLPEAAIEKTHEALLAYMPAEQDVRGYVPKAGRIASPMRRMRLMNSCKTRNWMQRLTPNSQKRYGIKSLSPKACMSMLKRSGYWCPFWKCWNVEWT